MPSNTLMFSLQVTAGALQESGFTEKLKTLGQVVLDDVIDQPTIVNIGGDKLIVYTSASGSHATLRTYNNGLVTLDVQYFGSGDEYEWPMGKYDMEFIKCTEKKLKDHFSGVLESINSIYTTMRRGTAVWPYYITADERIMEPDYDKTVHEVQSRWQNVKIVHSRELGNVLLLDNDVMLGESDIIYTNTLLGIGDQRRENYKDKEILILGGGDGGLLHELLKEEPKFVTMAEIDEEVIKACRTHMRSVCGDSMDKFEGPNYKIIIGDCLLEIKKSLEQGKTYDYVINDLTEFPVDKDTYGFGYDFETGSLILELSLKLLNPKGKFLARGNCLSADDYRVKFEKDVLKLGAKYNRRAAYVPGFRETLPVGNTIIREHNRHFYTYELEYIKCLPGKKKGNCSSHSYWTQRFEDDLKKICNFKRYDIYVPSFMENYTLYEVWKQ